MNERTKKILFAIGFSIVSIAMGIGLYYYFFRPLIVPTAVTPTPQVPTGQLQPAGAGQPTIPTVPTPTTLPSAPTVPTTAAPTTPTGPAPVVLLRDDVTQGVSPTQDKSGARFYSPTDGRFYKVAQDGTIAKLGDKQFFNVSNVTWSPVSDKAILDFPDGTNVVYSFDEQRQVTLPQHWEGFGFSPDGDKIVGKSIGLDPSNRFLFVSDPNGNEAKAIEPLGQNARFVIDSWSPNQQVIAFSKTGTPQPNGAEEVYLVGENHENFKSLIVPGHGFMPNWSPTGNNILYSVYHDRDGLRPSLWVSGGSGDNIGENRKGLNLQTWANKCGWQSDTQLICGVPQSLPDGAGLRPDDYRDVPDDVYRVDIATGVSTRISTPEQNHPILNPIVSPDGKQMTFTDAYSGRLYKYNLP